MLGAGARRGDKIAEATIVARMTVSRRRLRPLAGDDEVTQVFSPHATAKRPMLAIGIGKDARRFRSPPASGSG